MNLKISNRGRSKGAIVEYKLDEEDRTEESISQVAIRYAKAKDKEKEENRIVRKNVYPEIIDAVKHEFHLPNLIVNKRRILSRIERGSLTRRKKGQQSPIEAIEHLMVQICITKAKIGQPVNVGKGIKVANSLIPGSIWQDCLKTA